MNVSYRHNAFVLATITWGLSICCFAPAIAQDIAAWKKHIVHQGVYTVTAVAGNFSGDELPDVISNSGGKTRLFVAPEWKEIILDETPSYDCIHSESFDVDGDGDLDFIGARYSPGLIFWLEQPDNPREQKWNRRVLDDQLNGIHGLLKGDVDSDGKFDLIANSGQPKGPFHNSIGWLRVPSDPHETSQWDRFLPALHDAPGLSHYMGIGDVNGDGRPDIASAAKGGPQAEPGTGEWFAWWEAPADLQKNGWKKHLIADNQPGATNIHPADVNGDGKVDFIASRGHGEGIIWFDAPDWTQHVIHASLKEPHCLAVVDMDGDGDVDAATCAYGDKIAAWFENDGTGNFTTHIVGTDQAAYDLRAFDMDVDGDLDVMIAGQASENVVWFENPRTE